MANNETLLACLHFAGDLLSKPEHRCTEVSAKDKDGLAVSPTDESACSWCLTGALAKGLIEMKINDSADQIAAYDLMKQTIGLGLETTAPTFWDDNVDIHDLIAAKLRL